MKRCSSRLEGRGFSSVSAENNVSLIERSATARAYSALTMWLALPSPSGNPTTRFVCDEPATAKHGFHRINVLMSRGSLPVAMVPPKQVDEPRMSAGADRQCMIRNDG